MLVFLLGLGRRERRGAAWQGGAPQLALEPVEEVASLPEEQASDQEDEQAYLLSLADVVVGQDPGVAL